MKHHKELWIGEKESKTPVLTFLKENLDFPKIKNAPKYSKREWALLFTQYYPLIALPGFKY